MTTCPLCGHENLDAVAVCPACGHGESVVEEPAHGSFLSRLPDHTRRFLFLFYGFAFLNGIAIALGSGDADFILGVAAGVTAAWWSITDASDRGKPMRFAVRLLVILFLGLAAFFYLIASRQLRGFGWFVLNTIAYFATIAISAIAFGLIFSALAP